MLAPAKGKDLMGKIILLPKIILSFCKNPVQFLLVVFLLSRLYENYQDLRK